MTIIKTASRLWAALAFFCLTIAAQAEAPRYVVVDINPDSRETKVEGIGQDGSIQGFALFKSGYGAFTTGPNGRGIKNLGTLYANTATAVYFAQANGVTRDGAVTVLLASYNPQAYVGTSTISVILHPDGSTTKLPEGYVQLTSANGHYVVANEQDLSAYYYDSARSAARRVGDATTHQVYIQGVNNAGQVVGYLYGSAGQNGFITGPHNGAMTLLGDGEFHTGLIIDAINDSGTWAGSQVTRNGSEFDLVRSTSTGSIENLGVLTPGGRDIPTNINSRGEISGYEQRETGDDSIGYLYAENHFINITDVLNSELHTHVSHTNVLSLNDAGQAAVQATLPDGTTHGYLVTPTGPSDRRRATLDKSPPTQPR